MSYSLFITFTYFISFNHDHKSVSLEGRSCLPHFIDEEMSFMEVQWLVHSFQDFSATLLTQYQALSMTLAAYEIDYYSFRPGTVSFFLFIPSAVPILFSVGGTQNFRSVYFLYLDMINMFLHLKHFKVFLHVVSQLTATTITGVHQKRFIWLNWTDRPRDIMVTTTQALDFQA